MRHNRLGAVCALMGLTPLSQIRQGAPYGLDDLQGIPNVAKDFNCICLVSGLTDLPELFTVETTHHGFLLDTKFV